jgi:hypothetical protein
MKTCGGCGARYEEHDWQGLEAVGAVAPEDVRAALTTSDDLRIELRRCRRCETVLARRVA